MNKQQHKDEGIRSLFDSMEASGGSFGMDDRIMRAVQEEAKQQRIIRKHLQRALLGVAASIAVLVLFIMSSSGLFGERMAQFSYELGELGGFSDVYTIALSMVALLLLFVEMELVVKYWYLKEIAE